MPSQFEPCGLTQMIAMRYGALPVVRETGGLKDSVIPYNEYTGEGNGFSFANYSDRELLDAIRRGAGPVPGRPGGVGWSGEARLWGGFLVAEARAAVSGPVPGAAGRINGSRRAAS